MTGDPGRAGSSHVGRLVADQEAALSLDRPDPHQVKDHAGSRLPPIGSLAVVCNHRFRAVRTISHIINPRPALRKLALHPGVKRIDLLLGVVAMRDAGLVSNQKHEIAARIKPANRSSCTEYPAHAIGGPDVAVIMVDHPISIEKGRGPSRTPDLIGLAR